MPSQVVRKTLHPIIAGCGSWKLKNLALRGARVRMKFFRRDATVRLVERAPTCQPPKREGKISLCKYTQDIRRRLKFFAANTDTAWKSLLTVTYPTVFPTDGEEVKEHLRMLLQSIKRRWPGALYMWVREFQERDAPHYHILLTVPLCSLDRWELKRDDVTAPARWSSWSAHTWVSKRWRKIIKKWGTADGEAAGCRWEVLEDADSGARYMAAYASKERQKHVPDEFTSPGRWWGHSRDIPFPLPSHTKEVTLAEYLDEVDGEKATPDGWLFATLYNGVERAASILGVSERIIYQMSDAARALKAERRALNRDAQTPGPLRSRARETLVEVELRELSTRVAGC